MEQSRSESLRCELADPSKAVVQHVRVNEAALKITHQSVEGDLDETKECILSLRTETLRCEIHCRAVPSDAAADEAWSGCSEPEHRVRLAEATQELSRKMGQSAGRSTHDESMFQNPSPGRAN